MLIDSKRLQLEVQGGALHADELRVPRDVATKATDLRH